MYQFFKQSLFKTQAERINTGVYFMNTTTTTAAQAQTLDPIERIQSQIVNACAFSITNGSTLDGLEKALQLKREDISSRLERLEASRLFNQEELKGLFGFASSCLVKSYEKAEQLILSRGRQTFNF